MYRVVADMNSSHNCDTTRVSPQSEAPKPTQSPYQVQLIFVLTLLFVVLSVLVEYVLGAFIGLSIGEDFGLILGGTIISGICVGLVVGRIHHWSRSSMHR